jgi:hypothetical protein
MQIKEIIIDKLRIFEAAMAKARSKMNLHNQNVMLSGGQLASLSAELNKVCNTSPLKFWHSLSNICKTVQESVLCKL